MKKKILMIDEGMNTVIGDFLVNQLLPTKEIRSVGPIVFLEQVYPVMLTSNSPVPTGKFVHPHRGIATFSYVLNGSLSHYDSLGNRGIVEDGGIQWMKAGNGIIHEEKPFIDKPEGGIFQSLEFWINLPSSIKKEVPEYMMVKSAEVPELKLPDLAGSIRVLLGELGSTTSTIKTYGKQFIHHLRLNAKSHFTYMVRPGHEVAALVPGSAICLNTIIVENSKVVIFEGKGSDIVMGNPGIQPVDVILFGGVPFLEPIVGAGPFVMSSQLEIGEAYRDFFDGKYGTIKY